MRAWLAALLVFAPAVAQADERSEENDVLVHLSGPRDVVLERLDGADWVRECVAPCDRRVSPTGARRISGRGVERSDPFLLAAAPGGDETIDVHGGSAAQSTTGAVIFFTGLVSAPIGLLMFEYGASHDDCDRATPGFVTTEPPCHPYTAWRDAGIAISITGLVNVVVGAVLYATSAKSTATQTTSVSASSRIHLLPFRTIGDRTERAMGAALAPLPGPQPLLSFSF